jgi:hypothetical protein
MDGTLYPDSTKEPGVTGKAKWEEPLHGPSDRTVGNPPGEMSNKEAFYQNQAGKPDLDPPFPGPLDRISPNADTFSSGTKDALDTGGIV